MHHKKSDSHDKETNGLDTNNSKDNTALDDVKTSNVFERANEEFEAIAQALHHKKDSPTHHKRDETKVATAKDVQKLSGSPQGWMVRYGRRKIGRSLIHMRYFVLESRLVVYYKRNPQDNRVPIKTLLIDGNCRVEDRGLKTHHGHMVYVLSVYNKKEKYHRMTMAAFNIQEALTWKEKIEYVIDQHQGAQPANGNKYVSFEYRYGTDDGNITSFSDHESPVQEDDLVAHPNLLRRTTIGNSSIYMRLAFIRFCARGYYVFH